MTSPNESAILSPDFVAELQGGAQQLDIHQSRADQDKWHIAGTVHNWWSEHRSAFEGRKKEYYILSTKSANEVMDKPLFGESGETLRRYVEVYETYKNVEGCENLLKQTTFDHLLNAKRLYKLQKVKSPIEALTLAFQNKWTADEMWTHYNPTTPPDGYSKFSGALAVMYDKSNLEWVKGKEDREFIFSHLDAVSSRITSILESERKAE